MNGNIRMEVAAKFVLLLLLNASTSIPHQTHYVKPDPHTNCPTLGQQCQTLAYFIENAKQYFTSNTTMVFLSGIHQLSSSTLAIVNISDIGNFALVGSVEFDHTSEVWPGIPKPSAEIYCHEAAAFVFDNVGNLSLANITFNNCGAVVLPTFRAALFLARVLNLHMEGVVVQNSSGYGILGLNVLGNVSIYKSTLKLNGATEDYEGSNMRLEYSQYCDNYESLSLTIHSSRYLLGQSFADAAGLSLYFLGSCYTATVNISEVLFHGNGAILNGYGGNMLITIANDNASDTEICICNSSFQYGEASYGAGMAFVVSSVSDQICSLPNTANLVVLNSSFLSNYAREFGGGINMIFQHHSCHKVRADIRDAVLDMNMAGGAGGGLAVEDYSDPRANISVTISGGSVTRGAASWGGGIAYISSHYSNSHSDSEFVSSLHTLQQFNITGLQLHNSTAFSGNGGNMYIELDVGHDNPDNIQIYIYNSTFQSGQADLSGGGMTFTVSNNSLSDQLCSATNQVNLFVLNSSFLSNHARKAGGGIDMFFRHYSCHEVRADIRDVVLDKNTAGGVGGGFAVRDLRDPRANISVAVSGCSVTRGAASWGGGIAYISYHNPHSRSSTDLEFVSSLHTLRQFSIAGLMLHDNRVFGGNGGNMYIQLKVGHDNPDDIQIYIYNSTFQSGQAKQSGSGGGMAFSIVTDEDDNESCSTSSRTLLLHTENSYFLANYANDDGGGLYLLFNHACYHVKAVFTNDTFNTNGASSSGGAIAVADLSHSRVSTYVSVNHCSISGGNATTGGGIFQFSAIQKSYWGIISDSEITNNSATLAGGGVAIQLAAYIVASANTFTGSTHACTSHTPTANITVTLYVLNTVIANNTARKNSGGGLYIIHAHSLTCIPTRIHIADCTFSFNQAGSLGGNIRITDFFQTLASVVTLQNSIVKGGQAFYGGGIYYTSRQLLLQCDCTSSNESQRVLYINNTQFIRNVAQYTSGDIQIDTDVQDVDKETLSQTPVKVIQLENCTFDSSMSSCLNPASCTTVSVRSFSDMYPEVGCRYEFRLQTSIFTNGSGSLQFFSTCKAVISDCQFIGNSGTALQVVSSNIFFEGSNLFEKNEGFNGGAVTLLGDSRMFLEFNTNIQFRQNYATHAGGAIYVNDFRSRFSFTPCFFQPHMSSFEYIYGNPNISICMEDNAAVYAGTSIYGGSVDHCLTYQQYQDDDNITLDISSSQLFDSIFHILSPNVFEFSVIASDPIGVCMCEHDWPQCENKTFNMSGFPGALVVVPAITVGERNGTVRDGVIVAVQLGKFLEDHRQENVCTDKTISRGTLCQDVQFRLHSPNGTVNVSLMPGNQEQTNVENAYLLLQIDILPCPIGFQLQQTKQEQYTCTCDVILQRHGINCSIDDETIQRPPESWIGANCTNFTDFCGVIVHDHCPFLYCRTEELDLHLHDIDAQCNFNRSGILCGGCRPGYSLVLGTSQCLQCSNKFLTLLLVFATAGLALVFLLMLCNMTVSDGTINGLIFYANIVGTNSATFFPTGQGNLFTSFLSVFIAWINLDLGIETCFYNRMDMYQKTWLQFAFPLYIWVILLFLIITTHYSTLASKLLVRRNAMKVLATLFLVSFAKLLRTTIVALTFVILEYPDGRHRAVWLYDGNIGFLTSKHIPLFAVALLVFVFVMLPYTVVLTFSQCIQKKSNHQLLSWYTKLRLQPLFDAYGGPYKDTYQFWSGLLVILRTILFLIFALNTLGDPNINLLAISISSVLLGMSTVGLSVYKQWPLTILESFMLVNLCVISLSTHYVRSSGGSQAAVTGTLVGLVFVSFVATLSYRAYQELKRTKLGAWIRNTCIHIPHIPAGWRHRYMEEQPQQDELGGADGQPIPRRAPVQHWEIALEDPVSGEATLMPVSCTYPQPTQSTHSPHDTSASAHAREYSAEAYRRRLQLRYCSPESSTPPLSPTLRSETNGDPLQPCVVHLDADFTPINLCPSDITTSGHTGTNSNSSTTHYRAVSAFIGSPCNDNPEYEKYNELETIQHHGIEESPNEAPFLSSSSDYRDQIFELLAFDSSSHDHSQYEPENSSPAEAIHHDEENDSDTSANEYQSLLQN